MRTIGKVLFFIGLVLTLGGLIGGIGGIVYAVQNISGIVRDSSWGPGTATVHSESGTHWYVFGETGGFVPCEGTAPGGALLEVTRPTTSMTFDTGNTSVYRIGEFTAGAAGEYTVSCDTGQRSIGLVEADRIDGTFAWLIAAPILIVVGVFSAGIAILGLILWLVGRHRAKNPPPTAPPSGHPPGGFPPGGHQPGGFPPGGHQPGGFPPPGGPPAQPPYNAQPPYPPPGR